MIPARAKGDAAGAIRGVEATANLWVTGQLSLGGTFTRQAISSESPTPDSAQFGDGEVNDCLVSDAPMSAETGSGSLDIGIDTRLNNDDVTVDNHTTRAPWGFSKEPGRWVTSTCSI